ncbi:hypothetical protein DUI87_05340 [Hirundo rustica rustica]|uniref:Uncharacterized protein n=1 Tax=Hirundo rustica rustica TaxID=333673 RepID=A0A3M0KXY0_HIRRU|nr:hypothetical protein DUI87_05340 [Hirundo rustica rustica]
MWRMKAWDNLQGQLNKNLAAFGSQNQERAGLSSLDTAKGAGLDHRNLRVTKELMAEVLPLSYQDTASALLETSREKLGSEGAWPTSFLCFIAGEQPATVVA